MLTASVGRGVRAIFVHARTAILLWTANIALAIVALLPTWWWWSRTIMLPETDPLLERFQVGIFRDLMIDGGSFGVLTLGLIVVGLIVVALPISVFLSGGTLEVLITEEGMPFVQRFLRGGAHFFWRFLRLMVIGGVVMIVSIGATAMGVNYLVGPLMRSNWPPGVHAALAIEAVAIGVVLMYFLLSFDYARIRLALSDRGGVLRAWLSSLALVARHPVRTYGLACVFGVLFVAAAAGYLLAIARLGSHTMGLILGGIALQQLFVLVRAALRVGLLAGEMELYQWLRPATVPGGRYAPPEPAPAGDETIDFMRPQ
jgi:hypothetical protein